MNEQDRSELERLKQRQARLEQELSQLSVLLNRLDERVKVSPPTKDEALAHAPVIPPPTPIPQEIPAPALPPIIAKSPIIARNSIPPVATEPVAVAPVHTPFEEVHQKQQASATTEAGAETSGFQAPRVPPKRAPQPAASGSFEMRLGTYWLVRIGIVLVLTSLVFFGNLAYRSYIRTLVPEAKVALLYVASGLLLGAGAWWQRKAVKESLRNYAQVLFAGGLAAVYFTTYAAHHIEVLRVIRSATLDGALLLGWAGFMVWIADRKKSEVLALFAVGLAYYTSIITHVGLFTLYSNVLLTAVAVYFLIRNRWVTLTMASLVATYAAYAYWRFFNGTDWYWPTPADGLWTGTYFLICYWVLFTAGVFFSRHEKFVGANRAAFLTLNNGAFFTWFILTMLQVRQGGFWKFCLIYGGVLLLLAVVARFFLKKEPLVENSYLTHGLLLVTVGFIAKYSGMNLALILAAESVVLLMAGQFRRNWILLIGSYISAALAVGWGMDAMWTPGEASIWLGVGLGAMMLLNAFLSHRDWRDRTETGLRARVSYFTVLALAICLAVTWNNTSHENFPLTLAVETLALTASFYLLRIREVSLFSQSYMVLAQCAWVLTTMGREAETVWWKPALMIAILLVLSHWWQKQKTLVSRNEVGLVLQAAYALGIVGVFYGWLMPRYPLPVLLVVTSLLAVGITAYGVFTRAWPLAASGQIFMAVGVAQFALQLAQGKPLWSLALTPIAALAVFSFSTVQWFLRKPEAGKQVREPLLYLAMAYRWVALAMSIWWVNEYIPEHERIWVLGLLGVAAFATGGWLRNQEALQFSAVFSGTAMALFWLGWLDGTTYALDLLVVLGVLTQAQMGRRLFARYGVTQEIHGTVVVIGGLSLWLFLCRWVLQNNWESYLTASWSLLALGLFAAGILLRERVYRWLGLGILAAALGRVVFIDVWKLEALYRVLSFLALGIVLLVLGFLYNKYQEKLKEWL